MKRHFRLLYNDMLLVSLANKDYEDCDELLDKNTEWVLMFIERTYADYRQMDKYINYGEPTTEEMVIFDLLNYTLEVGDSEFASLKENLSNEGKLKYELLKLED